MSRASQLPENLVLRPEQRAIAQRRFHLFMLFNVCSFQCLSGNVITLFGLRIGLSNLLLGILFSVIPLAQVMPIVGRLFITRIGNVRSMVLFWSGRYIMAAPLLAVALLVSNGKHVAAVVVLFIGVLGFNLMRGIGMAGMQPLIGYVTTTEDRGHFMSRMQLIIHAMIMTTGLLMSLVLNRESPLAVFTAILAVGLVAGVIGTFHLLRLPELPREKDTEPLLRSVGEALRAGTMRRFLLLNMGLFAGLFMVSPFFIVFLRHVYDMGDNTIMLVTVIGSFGAIFMALLGGLLTDRIGAQPLLVIVTAVLSVTMLPLVLAPALPDTAAWIYGAMAFFVFMLGFSGLHSSGNVYFLSICRSDDRLNLGILYLLATGIGGTFGALAGGALLDLLENGLSVIGSFRVYFAMLMILFAFLAFGMNKLDRLGAYQAHRVLLMVFSIRDLRALSLLRRLRRASSSFEELKLIGTLGSIRSRVIARDLIRKLSSPRFAVRAKTLIALHDMEVHEDLAPALINELRQHGSTTAHLAADLAGQKGITEAIPTLRESLGSQDLFLASKAMEALGRLNDYSSLTRIEEILTETENPRLIIHAASALELFGKSRSIPALITKLNCGIESHMRDELILTIAAIMGASNFFYLHYQRFLESTHASPDSLRDELSREVRAGMQRERLHEMLDVMVNNHESFAKIASEILLNLSGASLDPSSTKHLATGLAKQEILNLDHFRFLVAGIIVWALSQEPVPTPELSMA